ncbi:MAG TPA: CDP-alcohol phosphatidyltransferase family protein [Polyangiales bacterium]|nr:CDP-alcohol phosphatidyltransferase family protein [Polyangiales bacterium]
MNGQPGLPPFETVLKSREVEDPVNLWVHRPLAYAFVALVYRTPITPNQVTFLSLLAGFAAAVCFVVGTPATMFAGGCLLWSSAILDGADGILARAKRIFSDVGRAIDGVTDAAVAAMTVFAGFYHVWVQFHSPLHLALMPIALFGSIVQIYLYDFYKEAYMQHTNPAWNGVAERVEDVKARLLALRAEGAPWYARFSTLLHVGVLENQMRVVTLTNPAGLRAHLNFPVSEKSIEIYRRNNAGLMQLWAALSLAPHCYGMSICAMFDRQDVYLWLRFSLANVLMVVAFIWQRRATRRVLAELAEAGLAPVPAAATHVAGAPA